MPRVIRVIASAVLLAACSQQAPAPPVNSVADEADRTATTSAPATQIQENVSPPPAKAGGMPPGALRVQMVEIIDTNGFEQPMPASFAFIPVGWQAHGGVQWGRQFACTNGFNYNWRAQSPDGLQTVAVLPQQKWETNNYGAAPSTPGCPSAAITSIQQYLQQVVAGMRPDASVMDYRPRPDLAAKLQHFNQVTPSAMGEMRTWVESGEAMFGWSEQGRSMRGVVAASAVFSLMRNNALGAGQTMEALTGFVFPGFIATAPERQLNLQFTEAIRQSFLPNPAWEARISRHNVAIFRSGQAEERKRSHAISEYNDYVSRIREETNAMRSASDERRQREFGETIKGVQTYNDPNAAGGQVELSNMYNHAWRLNDGSYVLSNDASFEPFKDIGVAGQRLEHTQ